MTGKLSKNFHRVGIGPLSKILAVKNCLRKYFTAFYQGIDDGIYICNATLEIEGSNFETFQGEVKLRIGGKTSYTTFIVAGILVSILVIFLLTSLCFKISGQRMKWQKTESPQTEDGSSFFSPSQIHNA